MDDAAASITRRYFISSATSFTRGVCACAPRWLYWSFIESGANIQQAGEPPLLFSGEFCCLTLLLLQLSHYPPCHFFLLLLLWWWLLSWLLQEFFFLHRVGLFSSAVTAVMVLLELVFEPPWPNRLCVLHSMMLNLCNKSQTSGTAEERKKIPFKTAEISFFSYIHLEKHQSELFWDGFRMIGPISLYNHYQQLVAIKLWGSLKTWSFNKQRESAVRHKQLNGFANQLPLTFQGS